MERKKSTRKNIKTISDVIYNVVILLYLFFVFEELTISFISTDEDRTCLVIKTFVYRRIVAHGLCQKRMMTTK